MSREALSAYILSRIADLGLSMYAVEKAGGVARGYLSHLEKGTLKGNPKPSTLAKVAWGMHIAAQELGVMVDPEPERLTMVQLAEHGEAKPGDAARTAEQPALIAGIYLAGGRVVATVDRDLFLQLPREQRSAIIGTLLKLQADLIMDAGI